MRRLASTSQPNTQKRKLAMNKEKIENVIRFLEENEQYGDDWTDEINELKKLIKCN